MKYSFSSSESIIKDIEVFNNGETPEALLYMPNDASVDELQQVTKSLEARRYGVMAGIEPNGAKVLRVSDFQTAGNLLAMMAEDKSVSGDYVATETEHDTQTKSKDANANKRTIKTIAGVGYTIGNLSTVAAGTIRGMETGKWAEAWQGAAWTLPGLGLIIDGMQTAETQMPFLYEDLNNFLLANDVKVPTNIQTLLDEHKSDNNLWDKVRRFSNSNSSTTFAGAEFIGASLGVQAGLEQGNKYKAVASAIMGSGMLLGAILPEQHHENKHSALLGSGVSGNNIAGNNVAASGNNFSAGAGAGAGNNSAGNNIVEEPHKQDGNVVERFGNWLQERPMRIAGLAANVQNLIKLVETTDKDNRKNFDGVLNKNNAEHIGDDEWLLENVNKDIWEKAPQGITRQPSKEPVVGKYFQEKDRLLKEQALIKDELKESLQGNSPKSPEKSLEEYDAAIAKVKKNETDLENIEKTKRAYQAGDRAANLGNIASLAFIGSNFLTMATDKDNAPDLVKSGGINSVMEMCANIVLEQPDDAQKAITQRLATFLGNHKFVKLNIDEAVVQINQKVEALAQSNWVANMKSDISIEENRQRLESAYQINQPATRFESLPENISENISENPPENPNNKLEANRQLAERMYGNNMQSSIMVGV